MGFIIDRFEDNDLTVLEQDEGTFIEVPRAWVPPEAREGDVLIELDTDILDGEVRYAVDFGATEARTHNVRALRASLPTVDDGDIEL